MIKSWILIGLTGIVTWYGSNPIIITWDTLKDVKYRKKFYVEVGQFFLYPTFGKSLKELEGKTVSISGYVIPMDTEGEYYVVSKYPMAQCFFCGGAGPETIVMLNFKKKPRRMRTDEKRCFTGRIRLNADRIDELNFILDDTALCE
ncbi:DUF3299 domain-containing protein [Runella sp. SP2]|uniref:DUF3299 domain-containing protein n=1 Tax=Runella sp. SP2 TaxID=2268026 RepID=UPI0013DE1C84|nr:DUF3299 domain-containing protein [Runella sp. SP2]